MKLDIQLTTGKSIFLRTLGADDASATYLAWLSDPEVSQFLEVRFSPPQTVKHLQQFIEQTNASKDSLMLGIFLHSENRHIGNIKLGPIDWNHSVADIGLLLGDKTQWGKGYATVAISLITDYAFGLLKLTKLTAGCYALNEGSTKAFVRAGFVVEGRRLSQWQVGDVRQDGILLGKVNPVFSR